MANKITRASVYVNTERYYGDESIKEVHIAAGTKLGKSCFAGCCNLQRVLIEGPIKCDGFAFLDCTGLEVVDGSEYIPEISEEMFRNCKKLQTFKFAKDCIIRRNAFSKSGLTAIDLSDASLIESFAFEGCMCLKSVTFSKKFHKIPHCAFKETFSLREFIIPDNVSVISSCAFYDSGLNMISIPSSVVRIEHEAFFASCLGTIDLTNATSLGEIGRSAFRSTLLTDIDMSNTVITECDYDSVFCRAITIKESYYA